MKTDLKKFEEQFLFYFCRKKPNGKAEARDDPGYVKRLAAEYYKNASGNVYPSEYQRFFNWLATEEPYFVDEFKFKGRLYEWSRNRRKIKSQGEIDKDFLDYVDWYGILADHVHREKSSGNSDCPFRKLSILCNNINVIPLKNIFIEKPYKDCLIKFFSIINDLGISADVITRMEKEMRLQQDDMNRARASGSVPNYYLKKMPPSIRGLVLSGMGYEIKQARRKRRSTT